MDDARRSVGMIFQDTIACGDAPGMCTSLPSLESGWSDRDLATELRWWFIRTFLSPEEAQRIHQAETEIERFFLDLERVTGQMTPMPVVRELQRRVVLAMHPSGYELCTGATTHPASVASAALKDRYTEIQWRARYS